MKENDFHGDFESYKKDGIVVYVSKSKVKISLLQAMEAHRVSRG
jgi:hypothetical protein